MPSWAVTSAAPRSSRLCSWATTSAASTSTHRGAADAPRLQPSGAVGEVGSALVGGDKCGTEIVAPKRFRRPPARVTTRRSNQVLSSLPLFEIDLSPTELAQRPRGGDQSGYLENPREERDQLDQHSQRPSLSHRRSVRVEARCLLPRYPYREPYYHGRG